MSSSMQSKDAPANNTDATSKTKAVTSSHVVTAESVRAEEVPTIPLDSMQTVSDNLHECFPLEWQRWDWVRCLAYSSLFQAGGPSLCLACLDYLPHISTVEHRERSPC